MQKIVLPSVPSVRVLSNKGEKKMKAEEKEKVVSMFQKLVANLHYRRSKAIRVISRETGMDVATIAFIVSVFCSGVGIDN